MTSVIKGANHILMNLSGGGNARNFYNVDSRYLALCPYIPDSEDFEPLKRTLYR